MEYTLIITLSDSLPVEEFFSLTFHKQSTVLWPPFSAVCPLYSAICLPSSDSISVSIIHYEGIELQRFAAKRASRAEAWPVPPFME